MVRPLVQRANWLENRPKKVDKETFRVYECVNCSRPVFTGYHGKDTAVSGVATGFDEEFLIFMKSFSVNVSSKCVEFGDNLFRVVTCKCKEDLGYFVVKFGVHFRYRLSNIFLVRCERVKAKAESRHVRLMEFVENQARSVLSQLPNQHASADQRLTLAHEFMVAAANAADEVAKHVCAMYDDANAGLAETTTIAEVAVDPALEAP